MAHLVPILGPSSPQLRQKSPPNRARNLKKRPQTPQDHPESRQRAPGQPWGSNFHGFGVDFGLNFSGFSFSLSFYSSWPPCLKFGTVAAWRAQRTGYPPPPGGVSGVSNIKFPTLLNGPRGSAARAQMPSAARGATIGHYIFQLKLAILVPTCCQEVPNLTPRSPKRAQLMAKIAQNTPQEPPTRPPKTPKCGQNAVESFVFTLRPFF